MLSCTAQIAKYSPSRLNGIGYALTDEKLKLYYVEVYVSSDDFPEACLFADSHAQSSIGAGNPLGHYGALV